MVNRKVAVIKKMAVVLTVLSIVAATITGIMTWANIGLSCSFFYVWASSFATAIFVMMPLAMLMVTLLTKLIQRYLSSLSLLNQNLLIGFCMALFMQSVMAFITTFNAVGYSSLATFTPYLLHALIISFPVGLAFALLMTTVIKPRLEAYIKS